MDLLIFFLGMLAFSSPAYAFPVVFSSMSNSVVFVALSFMGIAGYGMKARHYKVATVALSLLLIVIGSSAAVDNEINRAGLEHEYFPVIVDVKGLQGVPVIDIKSAVNLIQNHGASYTMISAAISPEVKNLSLVYFNDVVALNNIPSEKGKAIVLFSNYRNNAIVAANIIREGRSNDVYIVDLMAVKLESIIPPVDDSTYSYKAMAPHFNSIAKEYVDNYNLVMISGTNALKVYIPYNAILLSYADVMVMSDEDWKKVKSSIDPKKPLHVDLTLHIEGEGENLLTGMIAGKLGFESATRAEAYDKAMPFTILSNDNQITPQHYRSNNRVTATSIYGKERVNDKMTILCFTESCKNRLPSGRSSIESQVIDTAKVFYMDNRRLKVNLDGFEKGSPIYIAPEDSASSLLSYYLAYELSVNGYQFEGFIDSVGSLFGGAYIFMDEEGEDYFHYDTSLIIKISTLLNQVYYTIMPSPAFKAEPEWLLVAGLIFGLGFIVGGKMAVVSGLSMIALTLGLDDLFHFKPEVYQSFFVSPYALGVALGVYVISNMQVLGGNVGLKVKVVAVLMILIFSVVSIMMISPPFDYLYSGVLVVLLSYKLHVFKSAGVPAVIGSKYANTVKFVTGDSGFIVCPVRNKISKLSVCKSSKWIIRSNHLVEEESGAGGLFESKVCVRSQLKNEIENMIEEAKRNLMTSEIQYWVMPFKDYAQTGVLRSHASQSSSSFSYSIGLRGEVTDGLTSDYHVVHRSKAKNGLEKMMLKKLSEVEREIGLAVIIEFGTNGANHLDVLQVKFDKTPHSSFDSKVLSSWRAHFSKAVRVEEVALSPLSQSIVSRLYSHTVFIDNQCVYRVEQPNGAFDITVVEKAFDELKAAHKNLEQYILHCKLHGLLPVVADIIYPVISAVVADDFLGEGSDVGKLQKSIYDYMEKNELVPTSFELADEWHTGEISVNYSQRDLCKGLALFAFGLVKFAYHKQENELNLDLSLSSIVEGRVTDPKPEFIDDKKSWVIVDGGMPDKTCSLDYMKDLSVDKRKGYTLLVEMVPSADMGVIKDCGGVITLYGSPLCHLALTVKHFNVPCRIGAVHYDGRFAVMPALSFC